MLNFTTNLKAEISLYCAWNNMVCVENGSVSFVVPIAKALPNVATIATILKTRSRMEIPLITPFPFGASRCSSIGPSFIFDYYNFLHLFGNMSRVQVVDILKIWSSKTIYTRTWSNLDRFACQIKVWIFPIVTYQCVFRRVDIRFCRLVLMYFCILHQSEYWLFYQKIFMIFLYINYEWII